MDSQSGYMVLEEQATPASKHILAWASYRSVKVLVVEEDDLGEKHRFFVSRTCPGRSGVHI